MLSKATMDIVNTQIARTAVAKEELYRIEAALAQKVVYVKCITFQCNVEFA
jgi:hypothetical protein